MTRSPSSVAIVLLCAVVAGFLLGDALRPAIAQPADELPAAFRVGAQVRDRASDAKTFTIQEVAGEWFRVDDTTWIHAPTGMRWQAVGGK